jgi:hypothetical protein
MGCTGIKKYNCRLMVYSESTRHYWCTLRKFRESCEIHPPLADLYSLLIYTSNVPILILKDISKFKEIMVYVLHSIRTSNMQDVRLQCDYMTVLLFAMQNVLPHIGVCVHKPKFEWWGICPHAEPAPPQLIAPS